MKTMLSKVAIVAAAMGTLAAMLPTDACRLETVTSQVILAPSKAPWTLPYTPRLQKYLRPACGRAGRFCVCSVIVFASPTGSVAGLSIFRAGHFVTEALEMSWYQ